MLTSTSSSVLSCSVMRGSVWPSLSGPRELVAAFFLSSFASASSPLAALLELDRAERLLPSSSLSLEVFFETALPFAALVLVPAALELSAVAWDQLL